MTEKDKKAPEQSDLLEADEGEIVVDFEDLQVGDVDDSDGEDDNQPEEEKKPSRAEKRIRDLVAENKKYKKQIEEIESKLKTAESSTKKTVSGLQVSGAEKDLASATQKVEEAKRAFRDAYNASDDEALAAAQVNIASAVTAQQLAQQWVDYLKNQGEEEVPDPEEDKKKDKVTPPAELKEHEKRWLRNNPWFGVDHIMTGTIKGIHQNLLHSGFVPDDEDDAEMGTAAYWKEIDEQMSKMFPDKYKKTGGKKTSTPVTPPSGSPNAGSVKGKRSIRLTEDQRAMAARLGLTPERYAQELAKKQQKESR